MTDPLNREEIIGLLDRLGSEKDEDVLEAARTVHAHLEETGLTWDDLLVPDRAAATADAELAADGDDSAEAAAEAPAEAPGEAPGEAAGSDAEAARLIEELLGRSGISEELREELKGYKRDIADGAFDQADRHYLKALHARLTKS